jgi:predicted outer membrane repeat protein
MTSFTDGNSATEDGGGAVYARGGKVKVVNSRFAKNRCGAGLRVNQARSSPVYIECSTFEDGSCANGGAMSGLHVTFVVLNSVLWRNNAVGRGANPARAGTPGRGSGGAIHTDGDKFTVRIAGSIVEDNHANEGGGAVFLVSNDRSGSMTIEGSTLRCNRSDGFETIKGIFTLAPPRNRRCQARPSLIDP